MTELARLVNLAIRRHRKDLEARRRRLARVGLVPLDDRDDFGKPAEVAQPPAGGARIIRLERPAGGGRRETRG